MRTGKNRNGNVNARARLAVLLTVGAACFAPAQAARADDLPPVVDPPVALPSPPDASTISNAVDAAVAQASPANVNVSVRVDSPGTDGSVAQANVAASGSTSASPAPTDAASSAGTQQATPANVNVSVRVNSPGDDGAVTQANAASSGASAVVSPATATQAATPSAADTQMTSPQYQPDPTQYQSPNTPAISGAAISAQPSTSAVTSPSPISANPPVDSSQIVPTTWTWIWNWTCSGGASNVPVNVAPLVSAPAGATWAWTWSWAAPCAAPAAPPPAVQPPPVQPPAAQPPPAQPPVIVPVVVPPITPPAIGPIAFPPIVPPAIAPPVFGPPLIQPPAVQPPAVDIPLPDSPFVELPDSPFVEVPVVAPVQVPFMPPIVVSVGVELPPIGLPSVAAAIPPEYQPVLVRYPRAHADVALSSIVTEKPSRPSSSGTLGSLVTRAESSPSLGAYDPRARVQAVRVVAEAAHSTPRRPSRDSLPPAPTPQPPASGGLLGGATGLGGAVLLLIVALTGAFQVFRPLWRSAPLRLNRDEPRRKPRAADRDKPG